MDKKYSKKEILERILHLSTSDFACESMADFFIDLYNNVENLKKELEELKELQKGPWEPYGPNSKIRRNKNNDIS